MPEDGIPHGCMGCLFHFFDFNQRLHIRKMLAYNKKSTDGELAERTKPPKGEQVVSTPPERHQFMDKDANVLVEDKGGISRNNSGKVLIRSHNSKRRPSESDASQTSGTLQLLQTVSIHHSESNDNVDDVAYNSENTTDGHASPIPSEPHETMLKRLPDHLHEKHSLLREKLNNANEASSKKKGSDAKELDQDAVFHQSKEFLEMMVLLNNNRELLLKILKDPSSFTNFLESEQTSTAERVLDRSGSFVSGFSCEQNDDFLAGTSSAKPNTNKECAVNMGTVAGDKISIQKSESGSTDSARIDYSFETSGMFTSSYEPKDQRENKRDNRTASARFKVIKKRIKDVVKDNRKGGLRISLDGVLHKIPYGSKLSKDAKKETQGLLERPATTRYDRDDSRSKSIKRSHSMNESLDKYSCLLESIPTREFKRTPEKSKLKQEDSDISQGLMPRKTLGRIFSLPEFNSNSSRKDVQYGVFDAVQSLKIPMTADISESKMVDTFVHTAQDRIHSPLHEEQFSNEEDPSDWLTKTSAISDLELYFPEIFSTSETLELKSSHSRSSTYQQSQLDIYASDQFKGSIQVPCELDYYYNFFSVQVDSQNEAQFNYVRDILWKSGFGINEFLRAWYSPNHPVDPLLFEGAECTSDAATARNGPEMFLENQLLFDLINEVLLEIYDSSSSCYSWLSCFDTRTRPMPAGHHVLEEVWANISWHMNAQPQLDPTLDHAVARDFAKKDGWMDLQYDCEDVGLELEDLILDDLLDEVVLELGNTSGPQRVRS